MERDNLGTLVKDEIERKLAEGKAEMVIDYSFDFHGTPSAPNTSDPTEQECANAVKILRNTLNDRSVWSGYGLPYAYIKCRREVARHVARRVRENGHSKDLILCMLNGKEGEDCFKATHNYYEYYLGIANHPKAFQRMVSEVKAAIG